MFSKVTKFYLTVIAAFMLCLLLPSAEAQVPSNTLKIGDQTDTDKTIEANIGSGATNPKLIFNTTEDRWQFTNDGVNIADFGSGGGGGGGTNLLQDSNFNFETGLTDWTNSGGGTFVEDTSSPLLGEASAVWTPSASDDTLDSAQITVPPGFFGRTCTLTFLYNWSGTEGEILVQAYNGTTALTSTSFPATGATNAREYQIAFSCPTSGTLGFRLRSTAASSAIELDEVFVGTGKTVFAVPKNEIETKILSANVTSDGIISDLSFTDLEIGKVYELRGRLSIRLDAGASDIFISPFIVHNAVTISDFTTQIAEATDTTQDVLRISFAQTFTATDTALNFQVSSASANSFIAGDGSLSQSFIQLEKRNDLGGNFQEGLTIETSGNKAELVLNSSSGNYTLSSNSQNYLSNPNVTLTKTFGNMSVNVICSDGSSGGTTCSTGDEVLGFEANIVEEADYEICSNIISNIDGIAPTITAGSFFRTNFLNPGTLTTQVAAKDLGYHFNSENVSGEPNVTQSVKTCNLYHLPVGLQRFAIEQDSVAFVDANMNIFVTSGFQATFSIKNVSTQAAAVFTNVQDSLNSKVESNVDNTQICSFSSGSTGSSGAVDVTGCISTATAIGGATLEVTWNAGTWSAATDYVCSCTVESATLNSNCTNGNKTTTTIEFATSDMSGTAANRAIDVMCHGIKGN